MKEISINKGMKKKPKLILNKRTVVNLNPRLMSRVGGRGIAPVNEPSVVLCDTGQTELTCPSVQECPTGTTHDTGIPPGGGGIL